MCGTAHMSSRDVMNGDLFGRRLATSAAAALPTHASGMWSSNTAKRRQALYFSPVGLPTYVRERKCRHATLPHRTVSCMHSRLHGAFTLRGCRYVARWCAGGRGRGLAFENAQPVEPVSYLWTELMHLPRYESRGRRLRKTSTLIRLSTFTFVSYRSCYQTTPTTRDFIK